MDVAVDAIWISSPTLDHVASIKTTAEKVNAIYCEKPIASTTQDAPWAYDSSTERGVYSHYGRMRRYDDGYAAVKEYLDAKKVTIVQGKFHSFDWPLVEPAFLKTLGNIFTDFMCHKFNLVM